MIYLFHPIYISVNNILIIDKNKKEIISYLRDLMDLLSILQRWPQQ